MRHFTMLELLTVMTILAVLMGMTFGLYPMITKWSKDAKTTAQLTTIEMALEQFNQEWGYYPPADSATDLDKAWFEDLKSKAGKAYIDFNHLNLGIPLREDSSSADQTYVDAYSMEFYYECPGTMNPEKFDLWSTGKDRRHGGKAAYRTAAEAQKNDADTMNCDDLTNWRTK